MRCETCGSRVGTACHRGLPDRSGQSPVPTGKYMGLPKVRSGPIPFLQVHAILFLYAVFRYSHLCCVRIVQTRFTLSYQYTNFGIYIGFTFDVKAEFTDNYRPLQTFTMTFISDVKQIKMDLCMSLLP